MTKVYSGIPPPPPPPPHPKMRNFIFEMTKVYSRIPPPPPPVGLESGRSYVETKSVSPVDTVSLILWTKGTTTGREIYVCVCDR